MALKVGDLRPLEIRHGGGAGSQSTDKIKASGWNGFPGTPHKVRLSRIPVNPSEQNIQGCHSGHSVLSM